MNRIHYPFVLLILLISAIFFSCKKDKETPAVHPLFSKWHIASHIDTTYYFMINHVNYINYQGTEDDYFDIRKDDTLDRFENGNKYTTTYSINADTTILYLKRGPSGWSTAYTIKLLTNDSLQLDGYIDQVMTNSHDRGLTHYSLNKR